MSSLNHQLPPRVIAMVERRHHKRYRRKLLRRLGKKYLEDAPITSYYKGYAN